MRFAAVEPHRDASARGSVDRNEFEGLRLALESGEISVAESLRSVLAKAEGALNSSLKKLPLMAASKEKKRKKTNIKRTNSKIKEEKKKEARFLNFIKAAQFARSKGAAAIHPAAKLQLYGLLMQAKNGDCLQSDDTGKIEDSAAAVVRGLQLQAWRSRKGTSQEKAMEAYLELLVSPVDLCETKNYFETYDVSWTPYRPP